jgi:hypothetical protein
MTDQRLRDLYSLAIESRRRSDQCPPPEALLALVQREGTEAERLETLDHVMACAGCRSELDLLHAIEKAGRTPGEQKETTRARLKHPALPRYIALALAASLVLAIGLGPARWLWQGETAQLTRGPAPALTLLAPFPGALAEIPVTFMWRPLPQARDYTVEVMTLAGSLSFTGTTSDTALVASSVDALVPGQYQWWVRARTANDVELRSQMRYFRIRAR